MKAEKTLLRIIEYGTYLALFAPIIISNRFFFPFVGPKSLYFFALAEILFFSYLILVSLNSRYRPRFNVLLAILGAFLLILVLSSCFGVDLQESFWSKYERMTGLLMWFHLFAFFLVLSSVFRTKEEWLKIFGFSVLAAVSVSVISLLEKVGVDLAGSSSRGGATLGNSSFLGTYLLFNLFFALYLFFKTNLLKGRSGFYRYFNFYSLLAAGLIGLALWFSTAKAALLSSCGGLGLLAILWLSFRAKGGLRRAGICLMALAVLAGIAAAFFVIFTPSLVEEKLTEQFGSSTIVPRFEVYRIAWEGFLERPWLGWGPETFGVVFTKYFNPQFFVSEKFGGDVWYDRAHNVIFDNLAMIGILGFLGYLSIFAGTFFVLWKKYVKGKIGFWAAGVFSVVLIAYFVQNLTVFDMVNSYLMFFLVLAFAGSVASSEPGGGRSFKPRPWLLAMIAVPAAFCIVNFVVQPVRADYYVIKAVNTQPFTEERISLYEKSLNSSPVGRDQVREFFADSITPYLQQEDIGEKVSGESILAELDFLAREMEKSAERNPLNYRILLNLGEFYNLYYRFDSSKLADAERVLEESIELSPENQQAYWHLAQLRIFEGRYDKALSLAEQAVALAPEAWQAHSILIQIARMAGDQEILQEKILDALEINSGWESSIKSVLGIEES